MPEINPVTKDQLFEKKIAENTGSNYNVGDISDVVPVTKDQALLKEIALNSAGQSGDITELEGKVADNASAIEAIVNVYGAKNIANNDATTKTDSGVLFTVNADKSVTVQRQTPTTDPYSYIQLFNNKTLPAIPLILSGCPNVTGLTLYLYDKTTSTRYNQTGDEIEVTPVAGHTYSLVIEALNSAELDTAVTIYPMIRDARITDPTYVPYAMTNRELTERVSNIVGLGELDEYSGDLNDASSGTYRIGDPSKCTNLPNTTNLAWILLSNVGDTPTQQYLFGFQLIIGYSTTEVYIRYIWASWSSWIRLDNV